MKLYLSSIEIPVPAELVTLLGKPFAQATVALIPNAQDYYSQRAWDFKIARRTAALKALGFADITVVDLRGYTQASELKRQLSGRDLVWVMGGNTFCLRYEMQRSGFDTIIAGLLRQGLVWGGDSAGALVAGPSIAGIESADIPQFAPAVITEGLGLIPYVVLPHVDNAEFIEAAQSVRNLHPEKGTLIELKDSQAVIFNEDNYRIVEASA